MKSSLPGPILLLLVLGGLAVLLKKRRAAPGEPWPLDVYRTVLSQLEQVLYRRLMQALPNNLVFAQVQLWFNRISQLSAEVSAYPDP